MHRALPRSLSIWKENTRRTQKKGGRFGETKESERSSGTRETKTDERTKTGKPISRRMYVSA